MNSFNQNTISDVLAKGDKIELSFRNGIKISLDLKNGSHKAAFEAFCNRFPRTRCTFAQSIEVMLGLYSFITLEKSVSGELWKGLLETGTLENLESERALEDAARNVVLNAAKTNLGKEIATLYNENIYDESGKDGNPYLQPNMNGFDCWVSVDWQQMKKELKHRYDIVVARPIPSRRIPVLEGFFRVVRAVNTALFDKFLSSIMPKEKERYTHDDVLMLINQINQEFGLNIKDWQIMNSNHTEISVLNLREKLRTDVCENMLWSRC